MVIFEQQMYFCMSCISNRSGSALALNTQDGHVNRKVGAHWNKQNGHVNRTVGAQWNQQDGHVNRNKVSTLEDGVTH